MTPEQAHAHSILALNEATENLTFDAFSWAFEEVWQGVAWALCALSPAPPAALDLGERGGLPPGGSLFALLAGISAPPEAAGVVAGLEALGRAVRLSSSGPGVALGERADELAELVFEAWALNDACGQRLGLVDERLGDGIMLAEVSPGRVGSKVLDRRDALKIILASSALPLAACSKVERDNNTRKAAPAKAITAPPPTATARAITPLGGPLWKTSDPFLFCAYHDDQYPKGNDTLGPAASLEGRELGRDFSNKNPWRMYHGRTVPGFPRHPHRGFETVTVVRSGLLDHSDSLGATARYGGGDVQWLTSGRGIQHAEMFPLLNSDAPNPLNLFQIWINLPASDKMVDPHFTMLWNEKIPRVTETDASGRKVELTIAAGTYKTHKPPSPPPSSWATRPDTEVAIWTLRMEPGAHIVLPAVSKGTLRSLYVHKGGGIKVGERPVALNHRVEVDASGPLPLTAGPNPVELLLLQGRPIGEPVARRGPFVMNTQDEIRQAYADYRQTQFGGWTWAGNGPVHPREKGRFARRSDGRVEEPT